MQVKTCKHVHIKTDSLCIAPQVVTRRTWIGTFLFVCLIQITQNTSETISTMLVVLLTV